MENQTFDLDHETLNDFIPADVKFSLFLVFLIPSAICSLFILCNLFWHRGMSRALNNHVLIILLCISLICQVTIYPWMLYFYNRHPVLWYRTLFFCKLWGFIDWGLYVTQSILVAWTSIERHILVFHDKWVSTKRKRLYIHYLPMTSLLLYCLIFYLVVYFFAPCDNHENPYRTACVDVCLYAYYGFNMWETIAHQIIPNLIIVLFSIALLLRVLWQKRRIHQVIQWRKHRKMTLQLFSITLLYLIFSFPNTLLIFMSLCGFDYDQSGGLKKCAEFFSYFTILFFPFVCLFSLPELRTRIKGFFQQRKRRRIADRMMLTTTNRPVTIR